MAKDWRRKCRLALAKSHRYSLTPWHKHSLPSTKRHWCMRMNSLAQTGRHDILPRLQAMVERPGIYGIPAYLPKRIPCLRHAYGRRCPPSIQHECAHQSANHTHTGSAEEDRPLLQMHQQMPEINYRQIA